MPIVKIATVGGLSTDNSNVTTAGIDTSGADGLIYACAHQNATTIAPTDSKGNSITAKTTRYLVSTKQGIDFYFLIGSPTVGTSHTATLSTATKYPGLGFMAFSGMAASSALDQTNGATATAAASLATGSITPSEDGTVVITASSGYNATRVMDGSSPFDVESIRLATTSNAYGISVDEEIQTTATARNCTWTPQASTDIAAIIASFKAAAAGVGSILPHMMHMAA